VVNPQRRDFDCWPRTRFVAPEAGQSSSTEYNDSEFITYESVISHWSSALNTGLSFWVDRQWTLPISRSNGIGSSGSFCFQWIRRESFLSLWTANLRGGANRLSTNLEQRCLLKANKKFYNICYLKQPCL